MYGIALLIKKKNWKRGAIKRKKFLRVSFPMELAQCFKIKKLKRNANSAVVEVAEVALCASSCSLPISVEN